MMILTAKVDLKKILLALLMAAALVLALVLIFGGRGQQAAQTSAHAGKAWNLAPLPFHGSHLLHHGAHFALAGHHLAHFGKILDQLVHLHQRTAAARGNTAAAGRIQQVGIAPFLCRHGEHNGFHVLHPLGVQGAFRKLFLDFAEAGEQAQQSFQRSQVLHHLHLVQKVVEIKELKLRPMIDTHDYEVKIKQAKKFLSQGNKVKFTMRYKGREMSANDMGREVLNNILEDLEGLIKVDSEPKLEGRQMMMVVSPA